MTMKLFSRAAVFATLSLYAVLALGAYDVRMVGVVFDAGSDQLKTTDKITGDESVMYRFRPKEGQVLRVRLKPDNDHTSFIVYAPGKWPGKVLHDSDSSGVMEYEGTITQTGAHAVSVFQSQRAVAEGLTSGFEVLIEVSGSPK